MPPKRKAERAASPGRNTRSSKRTTRSSAKRSPVSLPFAELPDTRKAKNSPKKVKNSPKKVKKEREAAPAEAEKVVGESSGNVPEASNKTVVVIEHCKQCNSFKTRANQVKEGLENSAYEITVKVNPEKPRKGCFEIRLQDGKQFISLLDMKRPFKPMKDLDMDKVISDIIHEISKAS